MNNGDRLLAVLKILLHHTDEKHPMSAPYILDELQKIGIIGERKTIYRMIDVLNDNGYDIEQTNDNGGGYYIASRPFECVEIRLLIDAVLAASFISQKKTNILVRKLETLVSVHQAKDLHDHVFIANRIKSHNEYVYYAIDRINYAIDLGKKIEIVYRKGDKKKTHIISPYAMAWNDDNFYLIGNISAYDNLVHLRMDKILKAEIINESIRPFQEVSDYTTYFDSADYVSHHINMFEGDSEIIELLCTEKGFELLSEQFESSSAVHKKDGIYVRIKAASGKGMVGFLAQCGNEIKVISPPSLADSMIKHAESIIQMYK